MTMELWQAAVTIAAVALGTLITRFLPFWVFPASRRIPKYVQYLGKVLPFAVMGLLVVYSLKSVSVVSSPYGLPELLAVAVVVLLHLWKKNLLLSIGVGTVFYMLLVQWVFVG